MIKWPCLGVCVTAMLIGCARPAAAQAYPDVVASSATEALQWLFDASITPGGPFTGDGALIAGVLAGQSLTFPLNSSASGFTVEWNDGLKQSIPTSNSFGSMFAERGLTNGRGNLSVNLSYQRKSWQEIGGVRLDDGELALRALWVVDAGLEIPAGSLDEISAAIDFDTDVAVLAANYGLTNRLDIGVVVPFVRSSVAGSKQMIRIVGRERRAIHSQNVSGESQGLSDIRIRSKWNFLRTHGVAFAAVGDLRLPTGRTANLAIGCPEVPCDSDTTVEVPDLGIGTTALSTGVVASAALSRWSPHVNWVFGFVPTYQCDERFSSEARCRGTVFQYDPPTDYYDAKLSGLSNEWNLTAGMDYEVHSRVTASFDVIARRLIDAGIFRAGAPRRNGADVASLDPRWISELENLPGHVDSQLFVTGVKVNVRSDWLVSSSVLFASDTNGLRAGTTWVVSMERAFVRR